MSKKTNTLWFILGATVFNVLLTIICFVLLLFIYARLILPHLSEEAAGWGLTILLVVAIVASFFAYRVIIKQLTKRVDMEKYFDPIFGGRRERKRLD